MSASGIVIVAARLSLPGIVVAVFAAVSSTHDVAMCGTESSREPFDFDRQHQLVDADIVLGAFVGGETANDVVTVAAASRC